MALRRYVTVFTGERKGQQQENAENTSKSQKCIELEFYVSTGYIESYKYTLTVVGTRPMISCKDVQELFGIDTKKKAVARNEYDEDLITIISLKRSLTESSESNKLEYYKQIEQAVNRIIETMRP